MSIECSSDVNTKICGVTGVILAGGNSTRMRSNKSLLQFRGATFIERVYRQIEGIFQETLVVTNTPELYPFLPCRKVYDLHPGGGSLAGIHAGLSASGTPHIFVVACDMPFLNEALIRHLAGRCGEGDVVVPENERGLEPLHAIYGKGCLSAMEENLSRGQYRIIDWFDRVKVSVVSREEIARIDPLFTSFRNVNTPQEYQHIQQGAHDSQE